MSFVTTPDITDRSVQLYEDKLRRVYRETNTIFVWLFLAQWLSAIVVAATLSPYAWAGVSRSVHMHLELAVIGGLLLNSLPLALVRFRPDWIGTRHVVAATQMLWSALFVHLSGGRIETHFHIFGSLAFLSFYRDPRLLLTATVIVAADHLLLGFIDPRSVYGIVNPEWWRFLEHAGWVLFEDAVLILGCNRQLREMATLSQRESEAEVHLSSIEHQVAERTDELAASAQRYRALIENTNAIPWEFGPSGCTIHYIAPQIIPLFGIPASAVAPGQSFLNLLREEDREPFQQFVAAADRADLQAPDCIDSRLLAPDGAITTIRSHIARLGDRQIPGRIVGLSFDVTSQKRLEMDLLQAQKLESIGHLAAGIAHEINTPTQFVGDNVRFLTTSVQELLELIDFQASRLPSEDAALPPNAPPMSSADLTYLREEMPRALAQTSEGVDRIAAIVGAMKDFSHPSVEKMPCDLNRAISSTIIVARNEWKYVAEVRTELDPTLPLVSVMPSAFNQVILNMLVNSAHAIAASDREEAGHTGLITVSTKRLETSVEIRVQDSGCGIPADIRNRIFDPFFTTKEVGKGTGQGLAISRDVIVNKHGGSIEVESSADSGTTFIIALPLDRVTREHMEIA